MVKLSAHLSVQEFEFSPTAVRLGISNAMTEEHKKNAEALAENVFEKIRAFRGKPIRINSGYRSKALNDRIGGSKTSQHMKGEALDLPLTAEEFHFIRENLEFDQLIWEFGNNDQPGWVHVSYTTHGKNRKQVLRAKKGAKWTVYEPFK
jgi:hypothetical protein